jgi:hypothetical protein
MADSNESSSRDLRRRGATASNEAIMKEPTKATSAWNAFGVPAIAVFPTILDVHRGHPRHASPPPLGEPADLSGIFSLYAIVFTAVVVAAGKLTDHRSKPQSHSPPARRDSAAARGPADPRGFLRHGC